MPHPRKDMPARQRIDLLLVARGVFDSRARAQAAIAAGLVLVDGARVAKPSAVFNADAAISASPAHLYVSRGGVKLTGALDHFATNVSGRVCLDVGASTGGFSQVLVERGARLVYAVDVGRGQLHASLRGEARIVSMEETEIRTLDVTRLSARPDLAVIDASFISLKHILPATLALLARPADLIALIKPQFEAGRREAKKGVVRDAAIHAAVCDDIASFTTGLGASIVGVIPSPIAGRDGNAEFFIAARSEAFSSEVGTGSREENATK